MNRIPDAPAPMAFDRTGAVRRLGRLLASPTVSHRDSALTDEAVFESFRESLLPDLYPLVHARLQRERIGTTGLLYRWEGRSHDAPTVLMSHYDVVPVQASSWNHPPFCGEVHGDELWGRGALDTKLTLCAVFEAAEHLLGSGFVPENDIYLSFAGDEEVIGQTAPMAVDLLEARGIRPAMVLDEGGAVLRDVFPGVPGQVALVGVAEKGMMDVELAVAGHGGHASAPPRHTAAGQLAKAIVRLERRRFRPGLPGPVRAMLATLATKAPLLTRTILGNLWLFGPLVARLAGRANSELGAMTRTSIAVTMLEGSPQANVLPVQARAVANIRIRQGETMEGVTAHLRKAVDDPDVSFRVIQGNEASPETKTDSRAFQRVGNAASAVWPEALILPYLMIAGTDSRHFCRISDHVLRFSAMEISREQMGTIHNHNERVSVSSVEKCVEFYIRLTAGL